MNSTKPTILVVDDLRDWQRTLRGLLRDEGYQVQTAGSIKEALGLLEGNAFDLAVLDMRLDETDEKNTDGLKLAREISRRWPDTKIVVITGYGTLDTVKETMEPSDPAHGQPLAFRFVPKDATQELIYAVEAALKT